MQARVRVAERTQPTRGYMHMQISHHPYHIYGNRTTNFRFTHELVSVVSKICIPLSKSVEKLMNFKKSEELN